MTAEDLVSADGACPGMAPPAGCQCAGRRRGRRAAAKRWNGRAGHTECDVVRGIGAPDSVNLSNNPRGDRVAVVTYSRGPRAGIYTFTAGRLSSVEREDRPQPKAAKPKAAEAEGEVSNAVAG